jgi:L-fucose mutarotase
MLKNLDPLLSADLLYVLAAMGHGDEVAIVDANFPAESVARRTAYGRLVTVAGASMPEVVRAVLSVLPMDDFVDVPVRRMAVDDAEDEFPEVQVEAQDAVDNAAGRSLPIGPLERFAFYEAARGAYAVVLTGERRYFGNVLIKKGAIPPD